MFDIRNVDLHLISIDGSHMWDETSQDLLILFTPVQKSFADNDPV